MDMKFNIGDKVKSEYPGPYGVVDDISGFIIDAKPLGVTWIYKIQTDTGLRMIDESYIEIDKEWYRDQKIDSILN